MSIKPRFAIKAGSRTARVKSAVIVKELGSMRRKHGKLTATIVVDEATPENHPLHGIFEWNDTKAAHEYRLEQARLLLRSVVIVDERIHRKPIRAFVAFDEPEGLADYIPMAQALSNAEYRLGILAEAWAELRSWIERYEHLTELRAVCKTISRLIRAEDKK